MKFFVLFPFLLLIKFSHGQSISVSDGSLYVMAQPEYISDSLYRFKITLYNKSFDRIFLVQNDSGKIAVRIFCDVKEKSKSIAIRGGFNAVFDPHGFRRLDEIMLVELKPMDNIAIFSLPISSAFPSISFMGGLPQYGKLIGREIYKNEFVKDVSWWYIKRKAGEPFNTLMTRENYEGLKQEKISAIIAANDTLQN